ncbi:hypothetical protein F2P79_018747 [Pimephales promelas]|nr:hypothetical protein F2P79_018747 [Pimephales promelas]
MKLLETITNCVASLVPLRMTVKHDLVVVFNPEAAGGLHDLADMQRFPRVTSRNRRDFMTTSLITSASSLSPNAPVRPATPIATSIMLTQIALNVLPTLAIGGHQRQSIGRGFSPAQQKTLVGKPSAGRGMNSHLHAQLRRSVEEPKDLTRPGLTLSSGRALDLETCTPNAIECGAALDSMAECKRHPTVNAPQTTQAKKKKTHDKSPPAHPTSSYSKVTPPDNNDGLCALQPFPGILQRTNNGAVLRNPTQQNSTEADVEMTARNWLRLRRDRKQEGEHLKAYSKAYAKWFKVSSLTKTTLTNNNVRGDGSGAN